MLPCVLRLDQITLFMTGNCQCDSETCRTQGSAAEDDTLTLTSAELA